MSRSGYSDDVDQWALIRWRGAVASAIRGKRGQAFLAEMMQALDRMPVKRLIAGELEDGGEVCAIGAVGRSRGIDMAKIDPGETECVASIFGIPRALVAEIVFMNDEDDCLYYGDCPEERYVRMRAWVQSQIIRSNHAP